MEENLELHSVKRSAIMSSLSLFFQSGYSAALGLLANLVLTILLTPAVFGIYITTLSIIALFNYFSDFGLAASLIQKKEVNNKDLSTTFTVQQVLIIVLITIGFFASSFIKEFYNLPQEGVYLYWALLVSFFLSSLKTIPSILLERKIQFQKIVLVQIVENTLFYVTVIVLALMKYGLLSFAYAVILRSFVGVVFIYSVSFWMPRFGLSVSALRTLLSFGLPFQASSFLAIFKDDLIILYLGKVLGFEALGYIGWAKRWAEAFIRIIIDNVNRVIFPLIARFQHNLEVVGKLSEKILYYQTFLLAPLIMGVVLVMGNFVEVIPNYEKWRPALTAFYIFSLSSFLISFASPFVNLFNALGRAKTSFLFMLAYTVLTWVLTPFLVRKLGFVGFPVAHLIVSSSYIFVILKARTIVTVEFGKPIVKFIVSATVMGLVVFYLQRFLRVDIRVETIAMIVSGALVYFLLLTTFFKTNIFNDFRKFYEKKPLEGA